MRPARLFSFPIALALAAIALIEAPARAQVYQMEASVVDTGFTFYYNLALDTAGDAHALYVEGRVDRLYYNNNVGGTWGTPEFIHTTSDIGSTAVSAAVDSSGVAHVAYDSGMGGNDVFTYATNAGGSWTSDVVRTTSRWYSLDLSPAGIPRVAYLYDYSGLNYATLDGGAWSHTIVDSSGSITRYAGRYPDLVVDAGDHGHIVYYNYDSDSIRYATDSSGSWLWEELVIGPDSRYAEIALDPSGNVLAAYRDAGGIWIARRQGTTWDRVAVTGAGSFGYLDVKTDATGKAYVIYSDNNADTLMLAVEANGSFVHYEVFAPKADGSGPILHIQDGRVHALSWNRGAEELIHLEGPLPTVGILGDLNCDGAFNGADIDPFFLALGDPGEYERQFPNCDIMLGDVNCDGAVNGADIDPFFTCLGAGGCTCP